MFGFNFGMKKKAPRKAIKAQGGGKYKIVTGFEQSQRARAIPETETEDEILGARNRLKLINFARDCVRNNPQFCGLLSQI